MKNRAKRVRPKVNKRLRAPRRVSTKVVVPRTAKQFFALSEDDQDRWTQVTHVVSKIRADRISLTKASQEFGLDRQTVLRLAKPALRKRSNGQYVARPHDNLLRVLVIPDRQGLREVAIRDSRTASEIAEHAEAMRLYFQKGDESRLRKFKGKRIRDASGKSIELLTDTEELDRLGNAGELRFESLYARSA
jgi:hypothetical protein